MNFRWLQFAWRNTLRNRRRSAVTVSIAALGTAAILLAGGFALFTYQSLAQASARTSGHLIVANPAQFTDDEDVPLRYLPVGHEYATTRENLRSLCALPAVSRAVIPLRPAATIRRELLYRRKPCVVLPVRGVGQFAGAEGHDAAHRKSSLASPRIS